MTHCCVLIEFLDTNSLAVKVVDDFITFHLALMTDYFNKYFTDVNTDE